MRPVNRRNKINQEILLDLDRQAKDRILEIHLREALTQAIKPANEQTQPRQAFAKAGG